MAIHYNAFISYRHHPDDIRVAGEIHRSLERFRVPRSIRKRTGKINRLFRDKEELPISSNLSDDIGMALKNSDFLIVICSVHTKESVWVQREIELFLKTHDRTRVLTVLASGEPYDVIPEILLYEDVVDPETGEVRQVAYEPLSCDWRMKLRKAKREELPRLAAALLGCGYDELRQRQKQYRTRRLVAFTSAAAVFSTCLAAYFLHTSITIQRANEQIRAANIQIQENLNEALTNQSLHLATAAQERLAEGDRLTALSLALAALPDENNVRPYVPQAENVLISALGIYNVNNQLSAVGTVSPGVSVGIRNFWVTESETVLYLYDSRGTFTAWDTARLRQLGSFSLGNGYFSELMPLPNDNVLLLAGEYGKSLYCYTPEGELLWERNDCLDMALQDDGALLMISMKSLTEYTLVRLNVDTGAQLGEELALTLPESGTTPSTLLAKTLPAGVPVPVRYFDYGNSELYALNPETGEMLPLDLGTAYPACVRVDGEGRLWMMGEAQGLGIAGSIDSNRVTTPETREVCCYDLYTGSLLWKNEISASVPGTMHLEPIPGDRVMCQLGNVFRVLDEQTGELLSSCDAGSGIEALTVGESYATAVLQDGYVCYYWFDSNYCYEAKCAQNGVSRAQVGEGMYIQHLYGDQVTVYRNLSAEPAWVCPVGVDMNPTLRRVRDNLLAYQDQNYVYLMDMAQQELVWAAEPEGGRLLGFSGDGSRMFYTIGNEVLVTVDIAAGDAEGRTLPQQKDDRLCGNLLLREDRLLYCVFGTGGAKLIALDLNSYDTRAYNLSLPGEQQDVSAGWCVLEAQGDSVWLWDGQAVVVRMDLTTEEMQILAEETTQRPVMAMDSESGAVALANGWGITLLPTQTEEARFISLEEASAGSLHFRNGELFALCENGFLYRYDAGGNLLSGTKLTVDLYFGDNLVGYDADPDGILWQFTPGGKLVLNALGTGNVIDCDTWGITASISEFLAWDAASDSLVCAVTDILAGFRLYETGELLAIARQELGNFTLTQEQRVSYGID